MNHIRNPDTSNAVSRIRLNTNTISFVIEGHGGRAVNRDNRVFRAVIHKSQLGSECLRGRDEAILSVRGDDIFKWTHSRHVSVCKVII